VKTGGFLGENCLLGGEKFPDFEQKGVTFLTPQGGHYAILWEAREGEEVNGNCRNTQTIPVTIQGSIAGRDRKGSLL